MSCKVWRNMMRRKSEKRWSGHDQDRWQEHMAVCRECAQADAWDQAIQGVLHRTPGVETSPEFNAAVWRRIKTGVHPVRSRLRLLPAMAGALSLAVAVAAFVLLTGRTLQVLRVIRPPQAQTAADQPLLSKNQDSRPALRPAATPADTITPVAPEPQAASAKLPMEPKIFYPQPAVPALAGEPTPVPAAFAAALSAGAVKTAGRVQATQAKAANPHTAVLQAPAGTETAPGSAFPGIRLLRNTIHTSRAEKTRLEFVLPATGRVTVHIYSREGKLVKVLWDGILPGGPHFLEWDGSTDQGTKAASGVYLLWYKDAAGEKRFKLGLIK